MTQTPTADDALTVTTLPFGEEGVRVLRVAGEVDLSTVEQLRAHLFTHVSRTCRGVVLDFTAVSFLAACGIGLLIEFAEQARVNEIVLRLVTHHRVVLRALEVTGMDGLAPRADTVAEAVTQCSTCLPSGQ